MANLIWSKYLKEKLADDWFYEASDVRRGVSNFWTRFMESSQALSKWIAW